MAECTYWKILSAAELGRMLCYGLGRCVIIDSRSFLEFNTCHIAESVNVSSSKLIKRRLQQNKLCIRELLRSSCHLDVDASYDVIVYDQCTVDPTMLAADCFVVVLVNQLRAVCRNVYLLNGGFLEFQATHPSLCQSQSACSTSTAAGYKCPPLTSMSQPCLPVSNVGPTKILPFLFLGSQQDALSQETMQQNDITYVLNVSTTSPRPPFIQEGHFLRIPVNDSYCDKLLPFFHESFQFLDKVRESNSRALVHCLAGISRSPTLAIAYIMRYLGLTTDEAYKYVKEKRPSISPNFNFLGQLLEYEHLLRGSHPDSESLQDADPVTHHGKRACTVDLLSPASPTIHRLGATNTTPRILSLHSPTTALAQLNFTQPSPVTEETTPASTPAEESSDASLSDWESSMFSQLPMTAVDQLCFTSCFACIDTSLVVQRHGVCAKRLLDEDSRTALQTRSDLPQVTLRSHAKPPLVRPSSIAFSPVITTSTFSHEPIAMSGGGSTCRSDHVARKSRSLEDILNSPPETASEGQSGCVRSGVTVSRLPSAMEMLGSSACTDVSSSARYWPVADSRQNDTSSVASGGLSSGGRNSLHGSVEVIEVS